MAKDREDHIHISGKVVDVQCGKFKVEAFDSGSIILAQLAGKLRQNKIRVVLDDEVVVAVSVYDLSNGIIISRK